jgi:hypothetical protein
VGNLSLTEKILLQPEFYYSAQGAGSKGDGTAHYHYFCLPALAKLNYEKHYFLIGPQVAVLYKGSLRHEEAKQNVSAQLNPLDFSAVIGGGVKLSNLTSLELRYHIGISNTIVAGEEYHVPNRLLQFSFTHLLTQQR